MQMERGVITTCTGEQTGQLGVRVLGTCHTCHPARLHHNSGNTGQKIRDSSLPARTVYIIKLVLLQELHPTHLTGRQMGLRMQVFKGGVIGDHPSALAINVMAPLFECNNDCQELTVMCGVVALSPSELLAEISHRLQAMTLILLYRPTNAICRSISFNGEVPPHVRNDQHRGRGECRTKCLKCL